MQTQVSITKDFPEFDIYSDGLFEALMLPLDDGRFVVVTDVDGMSMPTFADFNVCVYKSESAFWADPTDSLIASATSDNFDDVELALAAVEFAK